MISRSAHLSLEKDPLARLSAIAIALLAQPSLDSTDSRMAESVPSQVLDFIKDFYQAVKLGRVFGGSLSRDKRAGMCVVLS